MNPRIWKETRSLLPAFSVTLAATIITAITFDGSEAWGIVGFVFGGGCVMLGACSFGNEFYSRTMTSLLAQPISRRQIWAEKLRVLAGALALAYGVWLFSEALLVRGEGRPENFTEVPLIMLLVPVIVFCSAPVISLLSKNILGSMALTALLPFGLWVVILAADLVLSWLLVFAGALLLHRSWSHELLFASSFENHMAVYIAGLGLGYSAMAYGIGRKFFLKFESLDSPGREVQFPARVESLFASVWKKWVPGYGSPLASLIRKELELHRLSFMLAGLLCAWLPFAALVWKVHPTDFTTALLLLPFGLYVLMIPLITGVVCLAEERNLGTTSWQFTLPPSSVTQWRAKIFVTLSTCIALGVVLPGILLLAGKGLLDMKFGVPDQSEPFIIIGMGYLTLFSLIIYASSISTNSMRAIITTLGLLIGAGTVFALAGYLVSKLMPHHFFVSHFYSMTEKKWMAALAGQNPATDPTMKHQVVLSVDIIISLFWGASALLLALLTLWFVRMASANFRTGELNPRRSWTQMSWIFAVVGALAAVVQELMFVINQLVDVPR